MTTPRFHPGDRVRVIDREQPGHVRTPGYIKGRPGRIERVCGTFPNPETVADGTLGLPYRFLYRVAFDQKDIWPEYSGPARDRLVIDLYEHWLDQES